jgi:serine/threonine-protein kinase
MVHVCSAVSCAHALGIVHRDLKPENIMVLPDASSPSGERVKVLDFGIAKLLAPDTVTPDPRLDPMSGVTRAGTFIGTPAYMSPEQCALLPVDTRADIYTCGVLLFQLVTGRLPFEGQTPLHTATLHIHEAAPRPSTYAPTIDPRLEVVIMKALSKKPAERHQTARHLASTLRKILADLPDVRVAKAGRPAPGSLRASGRTRNSAAPGPLRASAPDTAMESAKTMVADAAETEQPASVVLRPDARPAVSRRDAPPSSDPPTDSTPARIPPPARRVPSSAGFSRSRDEDGGIDSDDSQRTLVRAPLEDEPPRLVPQRTEVIMPSEATLALAAALGPPPAPPPPTSSALDEPSPPLSGEARGRPLGAKGPAPGSPQSPIARQVKTTLKSASEFKPTAVPAKRADAPEPASAARVADDVAVAPVVSVGGRGKLGSLQLGAAQLKAADDAAPPNDRRSSVPAQPPPAPARAGSPETAKMAAVDPAAIALSNQAMAHARTVPMISPSVVAAAIASGPRPTVETPPAAPPQPAAPAGPPPPVALKLDQPVVQGTVPMVAPNPSMAPQPAAPPPTPPVFPLAPREARPTAISGTRGLLIGFLAGALLMGVLAVVYVLVLRR